MSYISFFPAAAPPVEPGIADLAYYNSGKPTASQQLLKYQPAQEMTILAGAPLSVGDADIAATLITIFSIENGGVQVGTMTFAAAGTIPTFTFAFDAIFNAGDILTVIAPLVPDATLAGVSFTLAGKRTT